MIVNLLLWIGALFFFIGCSINLINSAKACGDPEALRQIQERINEREQVKDGRWGRA